jgi:hypothetical protein
MAAGAAAVLFSAWSGYIFLCPAKAARKFQKLESIIFAHSTPLQKLVSKSNTFI